MNIAVLIPCYNEEKTIAKVVVNFKASLPDAIIYVYDNNSQDNTVQLAKDAGAIVRSEKRQGKGWVVRRMFADIDADVYVMVDGDTTYEAPDAPKMVNMLLDQQLDLITGVRKKVSGDGIAYRPGHEWGNKAITKSVELIFGDNTRDMLSGYRVMTRRFVKSFPVFSKGFEIETELSVHALELALPCGELETKYYARPDGSSSKLSTYKDGIRIARKIFQLFYHHRPIWFFSIVACVFMLASLVLAAPLIITFSQTGLVPRFPTAILSASLMLLSGLSFTVGIILTPIAKVSRENKLLHYLRIGLNSRPSPCSRKE